jgi:c-di-GMP-binding flagellar brake protein YcgR
MVETESERRSAKRYQLDRPVCLWHESAQRFYSGRSVNISNSGALIQLPLTIPIRLQEKVDLNFPTPEGTDGCRQHSDKVFSAKVIRVNRGQSVLEASQAVALEFC